MGFDILNAHTWPGWMQFAGCIILFVAAAFSVYGLLFLISWPFRILSQIDKGQDDLLEMVEEIHDAVVEEKDE